MRFEPANGDYKGQLKDFKDTVNNRPAQQEAAKLSAVAKELALGRIARRLWLTAVSDKAAISRNKPIEPIDATESIKVIYFFQSIDR